VCSISGHWVEGERATRRWYVSVAGVRAYIASLLLFISLGLSYISPASFCLWLYSLVSGRRRDEMFWKRWGYLERRNDFERVLGIVWTLAMVLWCLENETNWIPTYGTLFATDLVTFD